MQSSMPFECILNPDEIKGWLCFRKATMFFCNKRAENYIEHMCINDLICVYEIEIEHFNQCAIPSFSFDVFPKECMLFKYVTYQGRLCD